ncbi:exosortase/archaeosortase family protein [Ferruginibacter paludis]|uniref:exosortase/archaeosortase family protein n=1 Tax=Ferruginibacter paludis TaxID=1310417 RepID=UPI00338F8D72|nr:exosortase/archaeosortase family protein [Ferruginibacter paludis]
MNLNASHSNLSYDLSKPGARKALVFFFIKLSLLLTIWFIIYYHLIKPSGIIDIPLTNLISASVVKIINLFSSTKTVSWIRNTNNHANSIIENNQIVLGIDYACNGIDLMFTYISLLLLLPYPIMRKIVFSIAGIVVITFANILRVSALYYIYVYYNRAFDFSHHYLFTISMDILIFYGWLLFIRKKTIK